MQVPERLALIGGSILLASTLIFTLKSQASSILPKIEHPISSIYDHAGDAQNGSFDSDFKDAQYNSDKTGYWGSSKYYIDKEDNLHIGKGKLDGLMMNVLGEDTVNSLKSINFDQSVEAPQNSYHLFSGLNSNGSNDSITNINNAQNLDVSHVTNMDAMISNDVGLVDLDLSNWNVSNVNNMSNMFMNTSSLQNINTSGWNVSNVTSTTNMFYNTRINPDFSNWHLNATNTYGMFGENYAMQTPDISNFSGHIGGLFVYDGSISKITLGKNLYLTDSSLSGTWKNESNDLLNSNQLGDGDSHPGTWTKQ